MTKAPSALPAVQRGPRTPPWHALTVLFTAPRLWVARIDYLVVQPLPAAAATHRPPSRRPSPPLPAAPLGLYGFALTTALLQGSKTQLTEPKGTAQLAVSFGFFFGGLAQFCAGLLEYQRRNTFGTVAFCW